jgi:hypothetical protein
VRDIYSQIFYLKRFIQFQHLTALAMFFCSLTVANAALTIGASSNGYPYELTDGTIR